MSSTQLTLVPSRYIMLFPHMIILVPFTSMTSSEASGGSCVGLIEYLSPLHPPPSTLTRSAEPLCICDSRARRDAAFVQKESAAAILCSIVGFDYRFAVVRCRPLQQSRHTVWLVGRSEMSHSHDSQHRTTIRLWAVIMSCVILICTTVVPARSRELFPSACCIRYASFNGRYVHRNVCVMGSYPLCYLSICPQDTARIRCCHLV